jgi:hypothetical protein
VLNLLGARSQKNSYARHVMGLYLYSTGATRQQISVMNHLGLSVSYVTLAGRGNKAEHILTSNLKSDLASEEMKTVSQSSKTSVRNHKHRLGTLEALSESMRKVTRKVAASNLYGLVYDNINMLWKVAEQILGRTGLSLSIPTDGTTSDVLQTQWRMVLVRPLYHSSPRM